MDDFRNIDFTNYLVVFNNKILGVSVAPGELAATGDLKEYADCRTPEYAAWMNFAQAKMICHVKIAGMDKFDFPGFSTDGAMRIPDYGIDAVESAAQLLLLPMDGGSGFSAPKALPEWNFSYRFANDENGAYWTAGFVIFAAEDGIVVEKISSWKNMPQARTVSWHDSALELYRLFSANITLPGGYRWRQPGAITAPGATVEITAEKKAENPLWREIEAAVLLNFFSLNSFNAVVSAVTGMIPFQNEEMRLDLIEAEQSNYCTPFFTGKVRIKVRLRRWN